MADIIYLNKKELSSKLLNAAKQDIDQAIEKLERDCNNCCITNVRVYSIGAYRYYLFPNDYEKLLREAFDRMHEVQRKLDALKPILGSGPEELEEIDGRYKTWSEKNSILEGIIRSTGGIFGGVVVGWLNNVFSSNNGKTGGETDIDSSVNVKASETKKEDNPKADNNSTYKQDYVSCDTPLFAQTTHYTCAFACAAMILNATGVNITEEQFIELAKNDNNLYNVWQTMNMLNENRYEEKFVERSESALQDALINSIKEGCPAQVNVSLPTSDPFGYTSDGHYIVVTGIYTNPSGECIVQINDPYSSDYFYNGIQQGQQIEVSIAELYKVWGHEWLVVGKNG